MVGFLSVFVYCTYTILGCMAGLILAFGGLRLAWAILLLFDRAFVRGDMNNLTIFPSALCIANLSSGLVKCQEFYTKRFFSLQIATKTISCRLESAIFL